MRVVSDKLIKGLLTSLTRSDLEKFQDTLKTALKAYNKDPSLIPQRIVISKDPKDAVHLFMPCIIGRSGVKTLAGSSSGFKGSVSIIDENSGDLLGVLNAMTLTAFRTALASSIPLVKFFQTDLKDQELSVFGNGLQAYWHVRLALVLYEENITSVQIIVRSLNDKSQQLKQDLEKEFPKVKFTLIKTEDHTLVNSTVVFGCIPSSEPSIHFDNLNHERPTFISIIGSYKPHMAEVDSKIIEEVVSNGGKIIIDSYEHTLLEAGELIQNGIEPTQCIEIGELDDIVTTDQISKSQITLSKIVGLAIMDISIGAEILEWAETKNLGQVVDFE